MCPTAKAAIAALADLGQPKPEPEPVRHSPPAKGSPLLRGRADDEAEIAERLASERRYHRAASSRAAAWRMGDLRLWLWSRRSSFR